MSETEAKKKLSFSIDINASREKIWETLLGKETFSDWCSYFSPSGDSRFEGDWSEGSTMRFIGEDGEGNVGGMITKIVEHRPGEYIRSDSVGVIGNGQEYYEGEMCDQWVPATEEYRVTGGPDTYTLSVNNDVPEPYAEHFSDAWQKGLARVKELAEA